MIKYGAHDYRYITEPGLKSGAIDKKKFPDQSPGRKNVK
jgi:hypothetical protein